MITEKEILELNQLMKRNREIDKIVCQLTNEVECVIIKLMKNMNDTEAVSVLNNTILQFESLVKEKPTVEEILNRTRAIREYVSTKQSELNNTVI